MTYSKPWRDYHPNFLRVMQEAANGGYRATFDTAAQANAFVRSIQKCAAAIRRNPDGASDDLRRAASADTGGAIWTWPRADGASWVVVGRPRPRKPVAVNYIAERLP